MRYLGIDYGSKKVGLALSDSSGKLAFPHKVLMNNPQLVSLIEGTVRREGVGGIVIGQSLDYQGRDNPIMSAIKNFKAKLEKATGLKVVFESEFLTTKQAERSGGADASAAALILQSYLERKR